MAPATLDRLALVVLAGLDRLALVVLAGLDRLICALVPIHALTSAPGHRLGGKTGSPRYHGSRNNTKAASEPPRPF